MAAGLPINVARIQSARAPSTRGFYVLKWCMFEDCCGRRSLSSYQCPIVEILTFLQKLFEGGRAHFMLKVYLATISDCHEGINGAVPSAHPLGSVRFLKVAQRLKPITKSMVPS